MARPKVPSRTRTRAAAAAPDGIDGARTEIVRAGPCPLFWGRARPQAMQQASLQTEEPCSALGSRAVGFMRARGVSDRDCYGARRFESSCRSCIALLWEHAAREGDSSLGRDSFGILARSAQHAKKHIK